MVEKKKLSKLEVLIRGCDRTLGKLERLEKKAREKWNRGYKAYIQAAEAMATLKRHGTKREVKLRDLILTWPQRTVELTRARDDARKAMEEEKAKRVELELGLARLVEQDKAERRVADELVEQVFLLNGRMVDAMEARNAYLTDHVYDKLVDDDGNMRTQVTIDSSDGTRRIVALVNTIQIVQPDLAAEAKTLIEGFFSGLQEQVEMDEATRVLFELSRKLLVEKTSFKIGPDFYRFLSLELDPEVFPELHRAQSLLKMSLRSEKTSSYVRLYVRQNRTAKWEPVKQS